MKLEGDYLKLIERIAVALETLAKLKQQEMDRG